MGKTEQLEVYAIYHLFDKLCQYFHVDLKALNASVIKVVAFP